MVARGFNPLPGQIPEYAPEVILCLEMLFNVLKGLLSLLSDIIQLHTGCPTKHDSLLNSFKCLLPYTVLDIKTRSLFR